MTVRPIKYEDYSSVSEWYSVRGLVPVTWDSLPLTGYIVPGTAAGFMFKADAGLCIIEGYVTNPRQMSGVRNAALQRITSALLREAQEQGFTTVMVLATDESIIKRAEEWGFTTKSTTTLLTKGIE